MPPLAEAEEPWWLPWAVADIRPLPASAGSRGGHEDSGPPCRSPTHPVQLSYPSQTLSSAPPRAPSSVVSTQGHRHTGFSFPALHPGKSPGRELGQPQLTLQISQHSWGPLACTAGCLIYEACFSMSYPVFVFSEVSVNLVPGTPSRPETETGSMAVNAIICLQAVDSQAPTSHPCLSSTLQLPT